MRLTWWQCGCLHAAGRHFRSAPAPWCDTHRAPIDRTEEHFGGFVVMDVDAGRYEWVPFWAPVVIGHGANLVFEGEITPDDRLRGPSLGNVGGGHMRPVGGRPSQVLRL